VSFRNRMLATFALVALPLGLSCHRSQSWRSVIVSRKGHSRGPNN
jgi:hypothetical protein